MNILMIIAGTNEPSNAATLAAAFTKGAIAAGATVETLRLRDLSIEHFTLECYDKEYKEEKGFLTVKEAVKEADGIVIASPIWNFSVPAHLKNTLDRMGGFALDDQRSVGMLKAKPFFLIFTGGAGLGAWKGLMQRTTSHIKAAIEFFGGTVLGAHFEPKCTGGKGIFTLVVDKRPESLAAMERKGKTFAEAVGRYAATGALPLKKNLWHRMYQTAQKILRKVE
ncbi:MAG: NAD(P)H-dependent oxidoreductase [Candidatus Peribacteraceae bacterium]